MRLSLTTTVCICILTLAASSSPGQEEEPDWIEVRKVLASDGAGGALFGDSAALDGDLLAVGAPRAAPGDTGTVYVFERHAGGPSRWGEVARLKPLDPALADLGAQLAVHGDTIAASAPTEGDGAAYVFERQSDGTWKRTRLLPPDQPDSFGHGVATDGQAVFVGSVFDDDAGLNAGAVYVYERDAGGPDNWGPVAKLTAADPVNQAYFGAAIAVDDGILVVGARRDGGLVSAGGAAHIFERSEGGKWIEVAKLTPSDVEIQFQFGGSVAVWGDTIVGGALGEDTPGADSGAAYVFGRDAGGPGRWGEVAKLEASDAHHLQNFGTAAAVDGGTLVVAAGRDDELGGSAGAAYVFRLADLDLSVTGACPGEISLAVTGAAPQAPVGLLWSDAEGVKVLPPGGLCGGMELGLEEPRLLSIVPADANGELALTRTASPGVCGRFLQTVEVGICNPSNTVQIP